MRINILFENDTKELNKYFEVKAFIPAKYQFACIFSDINGENSI